MSFIEFLKNEESADMTDMQAKRIVPSFLASVRHNNLSALSEEALILWAVRMFLEGAKFSTVKRYLTGMRSLYRQWATEETDSDPFKNILADISENMQLNANIDADSKLLPRLFQRKCESSKIVERAILLFLLYDIRYSLEDVIRLKKEDYMPACPQLEDIVDSMPVENATKFVFPLKRGHFTDKSLERQLLLSIESLLFSVGIKFDAPFSAESIKSLWIATALKVGISVSDIRSILPAVPREYACLSLLKPQPIDIGKQEKIISQVANKINDVTSRWHIMRLRSKFSLADIKNAIREYDPTVADDIAFYYPTRKELRIAKNGKRVSEETPVLPGILFFKLRSDKVARLVNGIYSIGWCYKTSNTPESPYATISPRQMADFQRHVGQFTSDVKMCLVERDEPFEKNTEVKIIGGGIFEGRTGLIDSVRNIDGSRRYTLKITDGTLVSWTITKVAEAFLEPAK